MKKIIAKTYFSKMDSIKGIPFNEVYRLVQEHQMLSQQKILDFQAMLIKELLNYAKNNIIGYANKYKNISLDEVKFYELPLLEKKELVSFQTQFINKKISGPIFSGSTSGSTGLSLVFNYDQNHAAWADACKWRGRSWFGCSRGDPSLILWGRPIVRGALRSNLIDPLKSWLRNEKHFNTFGSMNEDFFEKVFKNISTKKPSFLYGYGSSIGRMAISLHRNGMRLSDEEGLRCIQYTADHMSQVEKAAAFDVLRAPVVSDYGASEAPGIAEECVKGHLHVSIDCYKVEVVSELGNILPVGEIGDLVITSLHNRVMPLIRYRIGDVGRLISGECECGSPLPRMELVIGKSIDLITTPYALKVSAHYLDYININLMKRGLFGIDQFKLYQFSDCKFELHVVYGKGELKKSVEAFLTLLIDKIGPVEIKVEILDEIQLEATGKHRYFVNKSQSQIIF